MPRSPTVPPRLRFAPFRGRDVVTRGLLTRRQLQSSAWQRLYPDVYIHSDTTVDALVRCQAIALWLHPHGVLSHASAAYLWTATMAPKTIEVTIPPQCVVRGQPNLIIRRAPLPQCDVRRRSGMLVTTPLRSAFDAARHHDLATAVACIDLLLDRRLITQATLSELARERAGWPNVRRAWAAIGLAVPGSESPMESRARLLIVQAGLPCPVLQHEVADPAGRLIACLDMAYPSLRIGIEYDGDHHRERDTFQRDATRLNRLRLAGWTVLRFTADDVLRHPDRMLTQIRQAIATANG